MRKIQTLLIFTCLTITAKAQPYPDTLPNEHHHADTFYIVREKVPEHKWWGNSTYLGLNYNGVRPHEFGINVGRTYGVYFYSGGPFNMFMRSWGAGYSYYQRDGVRGNTLSAFAEVANFFLPPAAARLEYIYDLTEGNSYLRPAIGCSWLWLDIMYNYSFSLGKGTNRFGHGVVFRLKYYFNIQNWEERHPNRC